MKTPLPGIGSAAPVAVGLAIFAGVFMLARGRARRATTREDRVEAWGQVVPGFAGLLVAGATLTRRWPVVTLACLVLAVPTLVVGRAIYELIAFRPGSRRPPPPA